MKALIERLSWLEREEGNKTRDYLEELADVVIDILGVAADAGLDIDLLIHRRKSRDYLKAKYGYTLTC